MAGPFTEHFRGIAEALFGRHFVAADGYPEAKLDAIPDRCGYELPEALRDFYSVVGRFRPVMRAHNRFYAPNNLTRVDGRLVFCEENQVVVLWGYDEDEGRQTDPPVYQGVNNDEVEWYVEADQCSYFLAGMIYWQALFGGLPHIDSKTMPASVRTAAARWPLVWQDEDVQVFSSGPVVFSLTNKDGGIEVQAAGLHESDLAELWPALGVEAVGPN